MLRSLEPFQRRIGYLLSLLLKSPELVYLVVKLHRLALSINSLTRSGVRVIVVLKSSTARVSRSLACWRVGCLRSRPFTRRGSFLRSSHHSRNISSMVVLYVGRQGL